MQSSDLPLLNAVLNGTAAALLFFGRRAILGGREARHRKFMVSALSVSALFLVSYLTYHYLHGSTKYAGTGFLRGLYFTILVSHTILAAAVVPMVLVTVRFALKRQLDRHRRLARITWPVWMYVSVTGVVIYLMLYQL